MGRRGRPPYPDILTPRQWEVLAMLREGLSDQQIAERLDVSLAGAKYHVSEILTKLGVASREEAAAWEAPAVGRGWRWVLLPAAMALLAAVAAAIGVLVWGVIETDDSGGNDEGVLFEDLDLPPPVTPPVLTREQALVKVAQYAPGQVLEVSAQASTMSGILSALATYPGEPPVPTANDEGTAWLVRFLYIDRQCEGQESCGGPSSGLRAVTCRQAWQVIREGEFDGEGPSGASGGGPTVATGRCGNAGVSADVVVLLGAKAIGHHLLLSLPDEISAERMPLGEAFERAAELGSDAVFLESLAIPAEQDAWLVTFKGAFWEGSSPTPVPLTPRPSVPPECRVAWAIVGEVGQVWTSGSAPSAGCG